MDISLFKCTEEWLEAIGFPNGNLPMERIHELGEWRSHLWDEHYRTLSPEDRDLLDSDLHPCLDADRYDEALDFTKAFRESMEALDFVERVSLDLYHGNSLVLTVILNRKMHWKQYRKEIPELYRGVPVFTLGRQ
jgi:hypothetical protein